MARTFKQMSHGGHVLFLTLTLCVLHCNISLKANSITHYLRGDAQVDDIERARILLALHDQREEKMIKAWSETLSREEIIQLRNEIDEIEKKLKEIYQF